MRDEDTTDRWYVLTLTLTLAESCDMDSENQGYLYFVLGRR